VLLNKRSPCFMIFARCGIGLHVDHFGGILEFDTTIEIGQKFIMVRNWGENILEFGFYIHTKLFELCLGCHYFNVFPDCGNYINQFDVFKGVFGYLFPLVTSSLKNCFNFIFGTGTTGVTGFNKSKPDFLSTVVQAEMSTTILLCDRNGSPRIIGAHWPGAMMAHTDLEDQRAEGSCNCSLMYLEK
jgi:hypothetical protein